MFIPKWSNSGSFSEFQMLQALKRSNQNIQCILLPWPFVNYKSSSHNAERMQEWQSISSIICVIINNMKYRLYFFPLVFII